jgi:hypothetical protein
MRSKYVWAHRERGGGHNFSEEEGDIVVGLIYTVDPVDA